MYPGVPVGNPEKTAEIILLRVVDIDPLKRRTNVSAQINRRDRRKMGDAVGAAGVTEEESRPLRLGIGVVVPGMKNDSSPILKRAERVDERLKFRSVPIRIRSRRLADEKRLPFNPHCRAVRDKILIVRFIVAR